MARFLPDLNFPVMIVLSMASSATLAQSCHYQDWRWNVAQQRAVRQTTVIKDYSMLTSNEIDVQSGCSVCAEDQQLIKLDGLPEFSVCVKYAAVIQGALEKLMRQGAMIDSVIGYRVGRTRGDIDEWGNRVGFSNHSYGVAIDINTRHNGLYDNCVKFGGQCRLVLGGPWRPGDDPYSLRPDGEIVRMFKESGFKWGGEIAGQQKDFMHFSLTGY